MITETPHPHAEFLAEAARDINRKILAHVPGNIWIQVSLSFVASANYLWEFKFADTVNKTVSSLTDDELFSIADTHASHNEDVNYSVLRAIANAAAQRANEDSSTPTPETDNAGPKASKGNHCFQPKDFSEKELVTAAELASLYKNTKQRIF